MKRLRLIILLVLVIGVSHQSYASLRHATRLDSVKLLVEAIGPSKSVFQYDFTHPFNDIKREDNFYVGYLYQKGIIKGWDNHLFNPDKIVDGKTFCVLLLRLLGYSDNEGDFVWDMAIDFALRQNVIDKASAKYLASGTITVQEIQNIIDKCLDTTINNTKLTLRQLKHENNQLSVDRLASINANISDRRRFDEQDDYIYYPNIYDENKIYRYNQKDKKNSKILDMTSEYIQVVDDNIYFLEPQDYYKKPNGGIMKYNMTNKTLTKFKSPNYYKINYFIVFKDKIYFKLIADYESDIYMMDLNGKNVKKIAQASRLQLDENNLYTTVIDTYKYDLNGKNKTSICKESLYHSLLLGDEFYYIEDSPNTDRYNKMSNSIYKMNKHTGVTYEIFNVKDIVAYRGENIRIETLDYCNRKLVMAISRYSEFANEFLRSSEIIIFDLWSGKVTTIEKDVRYEYMDNYINVLNNKIYYVDGNYHPYLYSMTLDGKQLVEQAKINGERIQRIINEDKQYIYYVKYDDDATVYKYNKYTNEVSYYRKNIKGINSRLEDDFCTKDYFYFKKNGILYGEKIEKVKEKADDDYSYYNSKPVINHTILDYKVTEDYIYYVEGDFIGFVELSGPLYRINKKTREVELLTEDEVADFYIYNNKIYYSGIVDRHFEQALHRIDLDGANKTTIFKGKYKPWAMGFYKDKAYVEGTWEELGELYYETTHSLLEIDLNTFKMREVGQYDFIRDIHIYEGNVYLQDKQRAYRYNIDTGETSIILNHSLYSDSYFLDNKMLFYSSEIKAYDTNTNDYLIMNDPRN